MIYKHYILASQEAIAKRYIRERSNIGMIPVTVKSFIEQMYYHPLFVLESKRLADSDSFALDVMMAGLAQRLPGTNYFKEALEIRGNRKLLLKTMLELKLSGLDDKNIEKLKLEDSLKTNGFKELYRDFLKASAGDFHYPDLVLALKKRIEEGLYDKIFSTTRMSLLTEIESHGAEAELLDVIKSKCLFEALEKDQILESKGALLRFQNYLRGEASKVPALDKTLVCTSAITKETLIYKLFNWMKESGGTNKNTDVVLLNYDELAPVFYRLAEKHEMPLFLTHGLKAVHFSFFAQILTVLSGYTKYENADYILKTQNYLRHQTEDEKENSFRRKALSILSDIKDSLPGFEQINVHLDVHEALVRELKNTRLSFKDLDQDESGLWISEASEMDGLDLANVAILGLENSNYPKKKKLDPILKTKEREDIIKSTDISLSVSKFDPWESLIERISQKTSGNLLLGYNSHDLTSGKLTVPSSFYNHILKLTGQDVTIEKVYELCQVGQSFLEDIDYKNPFYPINKDSVLASLLEEKKKSLFAKEINELDFAVFEDLKRELSASSLQTFFECPLKFHLKYHKKLYPKDLSRGDVSTWLDHMLKGEFLHEAYEDLLKPHLGKPGYAKELKKVTESDIQKLINALAEKEKYRDANPDVAPHFKAVEIREMKENILSFITQEIEYAQEGFYPMYVEEPFDCNITASGEELKFSGFIDRIDTNGKGDYRVLDYKTGSCYFTKDQQNLFVATVYKSKKTYLQHAIYTIGLKDKLEKLGIAFSKIEAGYYFTSEKGNWKTHFHGGEADSEFNLFLNLYVTEAKNKKYYRNSGGCDKCDYANYCKKEQAERSKRVEFDQISKIAALLENSK